VAAGQLPVFRQQKQRLAGTDQPTGRRNVMVPMIAAVTAAVIMGFLSGLLTFRRAQHWCPACGSTLTCPQAHR
jgi:hypothetical protein